MKSDAFGSRRITYIAIILYLVVTLGLIVFGFFAPTFEVRMVVDRVPADDMFQVFFVRSDGVHYYNGDDAVSVEVTKNNSWRSLAFPLPIGHITNLAQFRIDTGWKTHELYIRRIALLKNGGTVALWNPKEIKRDFTVVSDISSFEVVGKALRVSADGNDPHFHIPSDTLLRYTNTSGSFFKEAFSIIRRFFILYSIITLFLFVIIFRVFIIKILNLIVLYRTSVILMSLLFVVLLSVFFYTVRIRKPWFGNVALGGYQITTLYNLIYLRNWYREGLFAHGLSITTHPKSIEQEKRTDRPARFSWMGGGLLPLYAMVKVHAGLSLVTQSETTYNDYLPDEKTLMRYNLFIQFFVALMLSLISFVIISGFLRGRIMLFIFSLLPGLLYLLLPGPLIWHQNFFSYDLPMIGWLVLLLFCEVWYDRFSDRLDDSQKRTIRIIEGCLLFMGVITEWFIAFFMVAVFVKRVLRKEIVARPFGKLVRQTVLFFIPAIMGFAVFLWQILSSGSSLDSMKTKIAFRTGVSSSGSVYSNRFIDTFIMEFLPHNFGDAVGPALVLSVFVVIAVFIVFNTGKSVQDEMRFHYKRFASFFALLYVPTFTNIVVFTNHAAIHSFVAMKFAVPLLLFYGIAPALLLATICNRTKSLATRIRKVIIGVCAIFCAGVPFSYALAVHPRYRASMLPDATIYRDLGTMIRITTDYNDIVVSPQISVYGTWNKGIRVIAYSMKSVHYVTNIAEVIALSKSVQKEHEICVLLIDDITHSNHTVSEITNVAYSKQSYDFGSNSRIVRSSSGNVKIKGKVYLYRIRKEELLYKYDTIAKTN